MSRAAAILTLLAMPFWGLPTQQEREGLEVAIQQVREGAFQDAALALDEITRTLEKTEGATADLARAYTYLSAAYLGLEQEQKARATFEQALRANPDLQISDDEFPPKFSEFFRGIAAETRESSEVAADPQTEPAQASGGGGGGSKTLLILGGLAAAGGVAAAAGGGGADPTPTPTTTVTVTDSRENLFFPNVLSISLSGPRVAGSGTLRVETFADLNRPDEHIFLSSAGFGATLFDGPQDGADQGGNCQARVESLSLNQAEVSAVLGGLTASAAETVDDICNPSTITVTLSYLAFSN